MWAVEELGGKLGFFSDTEVKGKNEVFQKDSSSLRHMLLDNKKEVREMTVGFFNMILIVDLEWSHSVDEWSEEIT